MPRLLRVYANNQGVFEAAKLAVNNLTQLNGELRAFAAAHPADELFDQVSLADWRSRNRLLPSHPATLPFPLAPVCTFLQS